MEVVRELREDSLVAAPEDSVDSKVPNLHPPDSRINQFGLWIGRISPEEENLTLGNTGFLTMFSCTVIFNPRFHKIGMMTTQSNQQLFIKLKNAQASSIMESDSQQSASLYTMACDESLMSRQVDGWMQGGGSSMHTAGVQGSRWSTVMQRSTRATDTQASFSGAGLWYMLAFMMPLLNIADANRWRCSQNAVLNFMELISTQMTGVCARLRCNIRSLTHNHVTREIFATAMDVVLVLYAIGFLVLSVYQAAIFA